MFVHYYRAGGHYEAELTIDADVPFELECNESVWIIPGTVWEA
jgi:hypothetical protein